MPIGKETEKNGYSVFAIIRLCCFKTMHKLYSHKRQLTPERRRVGAIKKTEEARSLAVVLLNYTIIYLGYLLQQ